MTTAVREGTPPITPPTLIRKEIHRGMREIEPTIGEATYREKIAVYLDAHGHSPIKALVRELGLTTKQVTRVLDRLGAVANSSG